MCEQLTIFSTGVLCDHCKNDPGRKSEVVWDGFLDKDTGQHVCFDCQRKHYELKSKTEHKGLYSEFPVTIK